MSNTENKASEELQSGASHVDETEQLAHGYSTPHDPGSAEVTPFAATGDPVKTELANLTLTMFNQGASTRVRVGNAHNASELYEAIFDSPDEANEAMLEGGILTTDQVHNPAAPAGVGITLTGITLEQLEAAGLKRHIVYTG